MWFTWVLANKRNFELGRLVVLSAADSLPDLNNLAIPVACKLSPKHRKIAFSMQRFVWAFDHLDKVDEVPAKLWICIFLAIKGSRLLQFLMK